MRYLTTTKNLFDISKLQAYTPETLPTNTAGVYNGSIIARAGINNSVCYSGKTLKKLCPDLVAGETYTLSFKTSTGADIIYLRGANEYLYKNNSSVITESMLNSEVGFYANYPESTVATISNFQIELGDTATPYVPYGYLPMNKGRYKASDVCQLLDKSQYPATQTVNGVTFTNNGDGTITVNGTANANAVYALTTVMTMTKVIIGHKYLYIYNSISNGNFSTYISDLKTIPVDRTITNTNNNYVIYTPTNDEIGVRVNIRVTSGYTANNLVFKPQLLDLTEMYGAGNEPTTVEEFKQKYPNELYPYSPYCWARIKSLIYKDDINYLKMK